MKTLSAILRSPFRVALRFPLGVALIFLIASLTFPITSAIAHPAIDERRVAACFDDPLVDYVSRVDTYVWQGLSLEELQNSLNQGIALGLDEDIAKIAQGALDFYSNYKGPTNAEVAAYTACINRISNANDV